MNKNDKYIMREAQGIVKVNRIKVKNSEKINIELIILEDGPVIKKNKEIIESLRQKIIKKFGTESINLRPIIIDYDMSTIK